MLNSRRTFLTALLVSQASIATAQSGQSGYPNKPIKILVGVPPGGGVDAMARMLSDSLQDRWGVPAVVENRPGANTAVAASAVAQAAPDGYTMMLATTAHLTVPLLAKLKYDPLKDFAPVGTLGLSRQFIVVNASVPFNSVQELIAYDKANPGKLNYGSTGNGGPSHFTGEAFNNVAGTRISHIPYKGAGPVVNDLISGQVQVSFLTGLAIAPNVNAGKLKALAVISPRRSQILPKVPTVAEAGLANFEEQGWYGVFLPAHTPKPIVEKLASAIEAMVTSGPLKEKLEKQGVEPHFYKSDEFASLMRRQQVDFAKIIKTNNIKID